MPARTATRILLDRVPPDLTAGDTLTSDRLAPLAGGGGVPDVFGAVHHIAVSTGSTSLRAYAAQQGAVLGFIGQEGPDASGGYGLGSELWPVAVGDLGLVVMSERALVPALADAADIHTYIASPRVYVTSIGPDATADVTDAETDLMLDGVRIAASAHVPGSSLAAARLWYGVLQSSLETEQALGDVSDQDPGTATLTGVSLAMTEPLSVVGDGPSQTVPPGAPPASREAVANGLIAVVPGPVSGAEVWWTIDPVTGETRSVVDPGLGGVARSHPRVSGAARFDTVYGKSTGAGNRAARGFPKQGANNNPGRAWNAYGNGYEQDDKYYNLDRPAPAPSRCGSGQEYTMLLGCVSVPVAWALRAGLTIAVVVAMLYVNRAWQSWLKD